MSPVSTIACEFHPFQRELYQSTANTVTLKVWIDGNHIKVEWLYGSISILV
ncbi:hypothetical protein [Vacuolonema iberomarrocanum]|uniref:hypothetical protein n=1 Tax=Vacuolonema iberomarrocanum TaxID=3454632 RepID=UPI003F6E145E